MTVTAAAGFVGPMGSIVLGLIAGQASASFGASEHLLTAGAFIQSAVPLVVFFLLQRFFVRGILGGAVNDVDARATAYAHRTQNFALSAVGHDLDARWDATVYPHTNGLYISFDTDSRPDRLHVAFPGATLELKKEHASRIQGAMADHAKALAKRFPEDGRLQSLKDRDALLQHPSKDVDIEVAEGRLTISGERRDVTEDRDKDGQVLVRELRYGSFRREFALPEGITADNVEATYDKGLLEVRVREVTKPAVPPQKVRIQGVGQQKTLEGHAEPSEG